MRLRHLSSRYSLVLATLFLANTMAYGASGVVLNELVSDNETTIADRAGDYSDWIELYNASDATVSLAGFGITDVPTQPYQWVFPPVSIEAGSYLIVWASGKDSTDPSGDLHTNFKIGASGESLVLTDTDGVTISVAPAQPLPLDMSFGRCPDGSETWCVFSVPSPGAANVSEPPTGVVVNEVMAVNGSTVQDEDGDNSDWIELYNPTAAAIDLTGYGISDDPALPFQWTFPAVDIAAGGYVVVWASDKDRTDPATGLHTNFKVSSGGEVITLTAPNGTRADASPPAPMESDVSYGRSPDGGATWGYFTTATPGASNGDDANRAPLDMPEFSVAPGFHTAPFDLSIASTDPSAVVRYALDGSEPSETSPAYATPLSIVDRTGPAEGNMLIQTTTNFHPFHVPTGDVFRGTVVRARAFRPGYLPSPVATGTYFITPLGSSRYDMPVASVTTDPFNLFDPDSGIYVPGPDVINSDTYLTPGANYHERGDEWERRSHFEFFEQDGSVAISQDVGLEINGNYAREYHQKSLRLSAKSMYGKDWMEHRFFPEKDIDGFKAILLRTASSDIFTAIIRDAVIQQLSGGLGFETQSYRPVAVFINGDYWGIQFLRDRYDDHHLETHHDVDPDSVDLLEIEGTAIDVDAGSDADYRALENYINIRSTIFDSAYETIREQMDTENYISYCTAEIISGNSDWPQKNVRTWRLATDAYRSGAVPAEHDGRWRWLMFDTERGLGLRTTSTPDWNTLDWAASNDQFFLKRLLTNTDFRTDFVNRFADFMNTAFTKDRMLAVIDSLADQIADEMPEHIARWGEPASMAVWEQNLDVARDFANRRAQYIWQQYREKFGLGTTSLTLNIVDTSRGYIRLNRTDLRPGMPGVSGNPYPWSGTIFTGVPIKLTAVPAEGYAFAEWLGVPEDLRYSPEITLTPSEALAATARFTSPTAIAEQPSLPVTATLLPNAPNPFNPRTTLRIGVPEAGAVRLAIFDVTGRRVRVLRDGQMTAGWHDLTWDGHDDTGRSVASGVYLVRLTTGGEFRTQRVTLVR